MSTLLVPGARLDFQMAMLTNRDRSMAARAVRNGARVDDVAEQYGVTSAAVEKWGAAITATDTRIEETNARLRKQGVIEDQPAPKEEKAAGESLNVEGGWTDEHGTMWWPAGSDPELLEELGRLKALCHTQPARLEEKSFVDSANPPRWKIHMRDPYNKKLASCAAQYGCRLTDDWDEVTCKRCWNQSRWKAARLDANA
jgi:hypothetical protein